MFAIENLSMKFEEPKTEMAFSTCKCLILKICPINLKNLRLKWHFNRCTHLRISIAESHDIYWVEKGKICLILKSYPGNLKNLRLKWHFNRCTHLGISIAES